MEDELRYLYLDLMKRCLLGLVYEDKPLKRSDAPDNEEFDLFVRAAGCDWPSQAHSMIGIERLENLQYCVEQVIKDNIPGDLIETGVWRGGACIFMRAILKAHGVKNKCVWVADSFAGLPPPNTEKYPQDTNLDFTQFTELAISLDEVKLNFFRYDLLDENVQFLKGWFRDTLPQAPIEKLSVLRLDGDLYESTMDGLINLYPKLSPGGFVIVDDYGDIQACRQAVHDYRDAHQITDEIHQIDWTGAYWRRPNSG